MPIHKHNWEFIEPNIIKDTIPSSNNNSNIVLPSFEFVVLRVKDNTTHEEWLIIENLLNSKPNGSITTSLISIDCDLPTFKRFGVALSDFDFTEIARLIKYNYLSITLSTVSNQIQDKRTNFLKEIISYGESDDKQELFVNIPVNLFNEIAFECEYHPYQISALRKSLLDDNIIRANNGRYTLVVKHKGRPERVVCFFREKLDEFSATLKEQSVGNEE